jgi:hypothetical protein
MGSRLSTLDKGDAAGPLQNVEFFKTVRAKWVEYFVSRLNENILSDLDISKKNEMLQWRDYFNIFADIRGFVERDNDIKQRQHWHPATEGFMMQKELPRALSVPDTPQPEGPADDFTEDEASDISESDQESIASNLDGDEEQQQDVLAKVGTGYEGESEQKVVKVPDNDNFDRNSGGGGEKTRTSSTPSHWNPEHMNPIFYGYSDLTVKVYGENIKGAKEEILRSEERAVEKALTKRVEGLAEYEQNIRAKEQKRQEKIDRLTAAYVEARDHREETMNKEKIIMPPVGFRVYKVWIFLVCFFN